MEFKEINVSRLIIHKIIGKTKDNVAYSSISDQVHTLDPDTKKTLLSRIHDAVGKSTKFFETKLDYTETDSFWSLARDLYRMDNGNFVKTTGEITEIAVEAHQAGTKPGGLLIIIDGVIDKCKAVIVIKAELQEALTLNGTAVQLIKELFLSPAKEFYKIGFLIHSDKSKTRSSACQTYVYDDNFSPSKKDLAGYFYRDFLGFSTSDNDRIQTNAFLVSFNEFVDRNVKDFTSRKNLKIRIKADYRESSSQIVDPRSYVQFFDDDPSIRLKYEDQIAKKFPRSFTKDLFLVDESLNKSTINITNDIKLSGPSDKIESIDIVDPDDEVKTNKLKLDIEDGQFSKIVVLKSSKPVFQRNSK